MKKLIAMALLSVCFTANAIDFKGVEIGNQYTYQDVKDKLQIHCAPQMMCSGKQTIGGHDATISLVFENDKSTLKAIHVTFSPNNYDDVVSVLSNKYKKPKISSSKVGSIYGELQNFEASWNQGSCEIYAKKYHKVNDSIVLYHCIDVAKAKEQKEKNKSDI